MLQKADFKLKVSRENALKWKNVLPQNISNETAFTPLAQQTAVVSNWPLSNIWRLIRQCSLCKQFLFGQLVFVCLECLPWACCKLRRTSSWCRRTLFEMSPSVAFSPPTFSFFVLVRIGRATVVQSGQGELYLFNRELLSKELSDLKILPNCENSSLMHLEM